MRWNVSDISFFAHVILGQLRTYKGLNITPTCIANSPTWAVMGHIRPYSESPLQPIRIARVAY